MHKMKVGRSLFAAFLLGVAPAVDSQGLNIVETEDLRLLYFDPTETYLVPRVIQTFHNSLERQTSILGYTPAEKTTVLLTDFKDYGNGGAGAVPANLVIIDIAPVTPTMETSAPAERMYTLMNHELVHISALDQASPADLRYRGLFRGKVLATDEHPETMFYQYLTAPRDLAPRWYHEGIAVFMETWMAGGLGRAQGGYDEMMFRSMVRDGAHFYDPLGLVAEGVKVDFQVMANAYLYGGRFMSYIAYTYSPELLVEWIKRTAESKRSYGAEFERVFDLSIDEAWQHWIDWEHEHQRKNLEAIRQFPTTEYEDLSDEAFGSMSRTYFDAERNSLIAGVQYPGVVAHIGEYSLDTRQLNHLEDVKVPSLYRVSSVAYDQASGTVFYTSDNKAYRDLMAVDLETEKARMLLHDARIGELVLDKTDKTIWGVRHLNGYASLVRIPYPYEEWFLVHSFPYGEIVYDMDISPDSSLLSSSIGNVEGQQSLKVFRIEDLLAGEVEPVREFNFGLAVPEGFVFSPDGQYLFGSSYYTGVSNIFRYELETGELEAVSNTETGLFRPIPINNEDLLVLRYTGAGLKPARIKATPLEDVSAVTFLGTETIKKHPQLEEWRTDPDDPIPAESRIVAEGPYVPIKNVGFESIHPTILGYKDSVSLGLKMNFSDPIRLDMLSIGAAYSLDGDLPSEERPNIQIDYRHAIIRNTPLSGSWRLGARLNHADFYDLFGPTKQSRKGYRYYVGYEKTLLYDEPRRLDFETELNYYADIDALPRYQDIPASIDKLTTFNARLGYSNTRESLGAVTEEKGIQSNIATSINHVDGDTIPKLAGNFDFGFALPIKNSSIWFRNVAGVAFGDQLDEFANFFFGGFGNNYVDRGEVQRYREWYAFPGFDLNAIPGRNFYRGMLEWNLPPWRFSRVGSPGFYMSFARPALFVSSLTTNLDDSALKVEATSIGAQLDFEFTVKSRYDMTLSFGYAVGYLDSTRHDEEFMVSLKIL
jgi:hypothetical protein